MRQGRDILYVGPRRGFTLIEILSATAMFSVLMAAVYMSFSSAMQMREQADERLEGRAITEYVIGVIKRDLEGVVPPVGLLAGEFVGEGIEEGEDRDDSLTFHSASGVVSEKDPWGDLQKIEYSLEDPEEAGGEDLNDGVVLWADCTGCERTEYEYGYDQSEEAAFTPSIESRAVHGCPSG